MAEFLDVIVSVIKKQADMRSQYNLLQKPEIREQIKEDEKKGQYLILLGYIFVIMLHHPELRTNKKLLALGKHYLDQIDRLLKESKLKKNPRQK